MARTRTGCTRPRRPRRRRPSTPSAATRRSCSSPFPPYAPRRAARHHPRPRVHRHITTDTTQVTGHRLRKQSNHTTISVGSKTLSDNVARLHQCWLYKTQKTVQLAGSLSKRARCCYRAAPASSAPTAQSRAASERRAGEATLVIGKRSFEFAGDSGDSVAEGGTRAARGGGGARCRRLGAARRSTDADWRRRGIDTPRRPKPDALPRPSHACLPACQPARVLRANFVFPTGILYLEPW